MHIDPFYAGGSSSEPEEDRHCCGRDSCTQCDLGYHERCRHGCTIVQPRRRRR